MSRKINRVPLQQDERVPDLYVPQELRRFQPANLYNLKEEFYWGSRLVLLPEMTVFDVGTYCGYLTTLMALQVGRRGSVTLFEQSEERLERARKLALSNGAMNIDYLHARIADRISQASDEKLPQTSIDAYVERTGKIPHVVKIAAGSNNTAVLRGMRQVLADYSPAILIYTGMDCDGSANEVREVFGEMTESGYRLYDLTAGMLFDPTVGDCKIEGKYLSGIHGNESDLFRENLLIAAARIREKDSFIDDLTSARSLVNDEKYSQALEILETLNHARTDDAEINYLYGCCLAEVDVFNDGLPGYFEKTLENGFNENWVRYHRGIVYKKARNFENALQDFNSISSDFREQHNVNELIESTNSEMFAAQLEQTRVLVKESSYDDALQVLHILLELDGSNAEIHYLTGFCTQMMGGDGAAILHHYQKAEELGYYEFWIRYNRSAIYLAQGRADAALSDIVQARLLRPDDLTISKSLDQVRDAISQKTPSLVNGRFLYVPDGFQSILPLSPCELTFDYEPCTVIGLDAVLRDDAVVFDIGASFGIISAILAATYDFSGQIVAFEPNPDAFLQANILAEANVSQCNMRFEKTGVGSRDEMDVEFFTLAGHQSVASTRNPVLKEEYSDASTIHVNMVSLDAYCRENHLYPDVIKLDIEGSECLALEGAAELLKNRRPDLVIETHWDRIQEIGGSLELLCRKLDALGYHLYDLCNGERVTALEFTDTYQKGIGYLLATREFGIFDSEEELVSWLQKSLAEAEDHKIPWHRFNEARKFVQSGNYESALKLLEPFTRLAGYYAEAHYLTGYCLHQLGLDLKSALEHYHIALQQGYDEFWIRFNRAALWHEMGDVERSYYDIERAIQLDDAHQAAGDFFRRLSLERAHLSLSQSRALVQQNKYEEAIELLLVCLNHHDTQAEANYLTAYCLQQMDGRARDAMVYYQVAMENCYEPFWIYYHRALLLSDMGDYSAAFCEISQAVGCKPDHQGARDVFVDLQKRLGLWKKGNEHGHQEKSLQSI